MSKVGLDALHLIHDDTNREHTRIIGNKFREWKLDATVYSNIRRMIASCLGSHGLLNLVFDNINTGTRLDKTEFLSDVEISKK